MSPRESRVMIVEAEPEPIEVDLTRTAIILVDMQNAFVSKGGYFDLIGTDISGARKIVEPCKMILRAARGEGIKVIYLQMGCSPDLSDMGPADSPGSLKSKGLNLIKQRPELRDKLYVYGTWGAEIIEELRPHPKDVIIKKQVYDGFIGTNLDIILRTLDIRFLMFLGVATNICVESTLRHAFFLNYFPILVSDAVSQRGSHVTQEATILNVQSTFGWVTTSKKILKVLRDTKRS